MAILLQNQKLVGQLSLINKHYWGINTIVPSPIKICENFKRLWQEWKEHTNDLSFNHETESLSLSFNHETESPYLKLHSKTRRVYIHFNNLIKNSCCLNIFYTEEIMKPSRLVQVIRKKISDLRESRDVPSREPKS